MDFTCTFFTDYAAKSKDEQRGTLSELAAVIEAATAATKATLPWLKFAVFGNIATTSGSLRHDRNVLRITGIEGDFDREDMAFVDAFDILDCTGVMSIIYTSPSHTEDKPRFRILCPLSVEHPPSSRRKYLARLNGLFAGAVSHESWTLSQAYYFGSVDSNPSHKVEQIYGRTIDQLDDLDAGAIGPSATPAAGGDIEASGDAREDSELIRRIVTGEGYHGELCAMAARSVGRGMRPDVVVQMLHGFMLAMPEGARDDRWRHRFGQIIRLVDSAAIKFDDGAGEAWRAVARVTYQSALFGTPASIRAAVLAEAERVGLPADKCLATAAKILSEKARRHVG